MPKSGLFEEDTECLCRMRCGHTHRFLQHFPVLLAIPLVAFALFTPRANAQSTSIDLAGDGSSESLPAIPAIPSDLGGALQSFSGSDLQTGDMLVLVLFSALMVFVLLAGWAVVREKRRSRSHLLQANHALQIMKTQLDQAESLLNVSDQLMIIWNDRDSTPDISGSLTASDPALPSSSSILAFGHWLEADCAQQIEEATANLRQTGQRFVTNAESLSGSMVEIKGQTTGGRALLLIRVLEGEDRDRARLAHEATRQAKELSRLKLILNSMPMPVWSRDDAGQISWTNNAYLAAVEANSVEDVLKDQIELLDQRGRELVAKGLTKADPLAPKSDIVAQSSASRLPVIVAGKRQIFDILDIHLEQGAVGVASDVTSIDDAEKTLERMQSFHADTMNQLTTPVAFFDSTQQLQYYNAAYADQFKLDMHFLDGHPHESAILDRMRTNRCLPEQADYHGWKSEFLASYHEVEAREHWWHLPDGQSLRVIATPNPIGGVTYIFENVTERLELEKRYNALFRMQSETLDHLTDGVVVFGSDGRLRVSNPAFMKIWDFPVDLLKDQPHVGAVLEWCRRKFGDEHVWARLKGSVVGLADKREGVSGRMECNDGEFLDYAAIPLPDGATMITFVDVTDNVKVERGLIDRNEALIAADQLKNTFIQHVSYELRTPLTNIIGYTELLTSEAFGALNDRQREYTDHIMTSSSSLQAIVNDILDLATIDAGIMALELGQVDPVDSIRAATEGLQDRLAAKEISLDIEVAENMGEFVGDPKRVRQVLFNLISNAIRFSDPSSSISVFADRTNEGITFRIKDSGCGMPEDYKDFAFDRFESRKTGEQRGGVGLGLSIVKSFVDLHGGEVSIESEVGKGTQVTCKFPFNPKALTPSNSEAAE